MTRPSRRGTFRPLPESASSTGVPDGDDIDWPTGVYTPPDVDVSGFELNTEGGQSVIHPHGSTGTTETIDPTLGNVHTLTLDADCAFTLGAPAGSGACELEVEVTASGTHTWSWPNVDAWLTQGGVEPDPPASGETALIVFRSVDGGTTWLGIPIGAGASATPTGAAGGDLSGTYPNPSVVDDSHSHTTATAPGGTSSTDAAIWRPLMDGAGAVVTDSTTGEAIMAYGPA